MRFSIRKTFFFRNYLKEEKWAVCGVWGGFKFDEKNAFRN